MSDAVPLISRQRLIILGASDLIAHWTTHIMKCLVSGLAATFIFIIIIVMYIVAAKASETSPPQGYIFFIDASERVTTERACAAESVVRLNKDVPCYLFIVSNPTPALKLLDDIYPNFYIRKWNWMANLRETPMEPWRDNLELLRMHLLNSSAESLEMTARALILWKYGGTSVSLERVTAEEEEGLKSVGSIDYDYVDACDGALIRLQPCHVFMEKLILEIMRKVEDGERYNATELFTKVLRHICPFTKDLVTGTSNCFGMKVYNDPSSCPRKDLDRNVSNVCPRVKSFADFEVKSVKLNKNLII